MRPVDVTLVADRLTVPGAITSVFDTVNVIFGTGVPPAGGAAVAVMAIGFDVVVAPTLSVATAVMVVTPAVAAACVYVYGAAALVASSVVPL